MCRRCRNSPKPVSALSEGNNIISNYYGHLYNRVWWQWLSRMVSQVLGWGTAGFPDTMAMKSLCIWNISLMFNLVLWGLMHHAFECVTFVIRMLSWTFSGSSTLRFISVYTDNPWVKFLWFPVLQNLWYVFSAWLYRLYTATIIAWNFSVVTGNNEPHECVIVIRTGSGGINRLCFRMRSNCGRLNL